jgi:hypothetical protein
MLGDHQLATESFAQLSLGRLDHATVRGPANATLALAKADRG